MLSRKPGTALKRQPLPRRTQRLAPVSAGLGATRRQQQRAYEVVDAEADGCCFTCKQWGPTQHSHLFPQGMNQLLKATAANIVAECPACHTLWGEKLPEYARRYPVALAAKVTLMKTVNRQRWAFWMMKNEHLLRLK